MKAEKGIAVVLALSMLSILWLIANQPNNIPHWGYLQEIKQQEFEAGCNAECMKRQEEKKYSCTSRP